jgi:hypothetical protein
MGLQLDTPNIFISYKWTIDKLPFAQRTIEFEARQSGRQAGIVPEALAQDRVEPGGRLWRAGLVVGFKTLNHVCCCKTLYICMAYFIFSTQRKLCCCFYPRNETLPDKKLTPTPRNDPKNIDVISEAHKKF